MTTDIMSWANDHSVAIATIVSIALALLGAWIGFWGYVRHYQHKLGVRKTMRFSKVLPTLSLIIWFTICLKLERASTPRGLLVDLLMPPDRADDVLYNLLARYDHWVEKHGLRWARIIFFTQSVFAIGMFWSDWALKRLKLLKMFVSN